MTRACIPTANAEQMKSEVYADTVGYNEFDRGAMRTLFITGNTHIDTRKKECLCRL